MLPRSWLLCQGVLSCMRTVVSGAGALEVAQMHAILDSLPGDRGRVLDYLTRTLGFRVEISPGQD